MGRQKSRRLNQRDARAAKGVGLAKLGHLKQLPTKKEAWHVRAHAIKRAMERYNVRLSHRDIKDMNANIRGERKRYCRNTHRKNKVVHDHSTKSFGQM